MSKNPTQNKNSVEKQQTPFIVDSLPAENKKSSIRRKKFFIILSAFLFSIFLFTAIFILHKAEEISFEDFETLETSVNQKAPLTYYVFNRVVINAVFSLNLLLLMILLLVLFRNLIKLYLDRRHKKLGAQFKTRLIFAFIGFSLIPTVLLFVVASGLISDSINRWFSLPADELVSQALDAAKVFNEYTRQQTLYFAEQVSKTIKESGLEASFWEEPLNNDTLKKLENLLTQERQKLGLTGLSIFKAEKELISVWQEGFLQPAKSIETASFLKRAQIENKITQVVSLASSIEKNPLLGTGDYLKGEIVQAVVSNLDESEKNKSQPIIVVANAFVKPSIVSLETDILRRFSDYRQLQHEQNPIRGIYLVGLLLAALSIIFSATWLGFRLARGITIPIQQLAQGTEALAAGNLDYQIKTQANGASGEIGILIDSFNKMTQDLKMSKSKVEKAYLDLEKTNKELDQRRSYMETILENIAAGVISVDPEGYIRTLNKAALKILNLDPGKVLGFHYKETFDNFEFSAIKNLISKKEKTRREIIEKELKLSLAGANITLLTIVTNLKDSEDRPLGMVLVFEDITQLIKAQHVEAWGEVAQRIAHEIKNPLTPIQLSAQRLKKRFDEGDPQLGKILTECTDTIIREVNSLEVLVKEFSRFARMPALKPTLEDLNKVIEETLSLYSERRQQVQIFTHLDKNLPPVYLDSEQIRRVFINLIDNALEAVTDTSTGKNETGNIQISTSFDSSQQVARIQIADNGPGMSPEVREKIFLPYFSTKNKGTGLGLAIVNRIIADHGGSIKVKANQPSGTLFIIELPTVYIDKSVIQSLEPQTVL